MAGSLPSEWWAFVVLGLCAGVMSGTLGLGSGVIVIPALVLLLGFEQKSAQGTALAVMVPMTLLGAVRYWRNPQIEMHGMVILLLVVGAVVGTMVGTEFVTRLPVGTLRKVFALILVIVAVRMFTAAARPGKVPVRTDAGSPPGAEMVEPGEGNDSGPGVLPNRE